MGLLDEALQWIDARKRFVANTGRDIAADPAQGLGLLDFLTDPVALDDMRRRALSLAQSGARGFTTGLLGAPVDIANTMMANAGGDAPVGGSEWIGNKLEGMGLLAPKPTDMAGTASEFMGGLINPAGALKGAAAIKPLSAAIAFHGSPHTFDKFDMSKIGTGEGAQAYGHGLYFAENPAVAADYAGRLADKPKDVIGSYIDYSAKYGRPLGEGSTSKGYLESQGFPAEHAPLLDKIISGATVGKDGGITYSPTAMQAFRQFDNAFSTKGIKYKVDIPDSAIDKMLHWDKPLSEQQAAQVASTVKAVPVNVGHGRYGLATVGPDGSGRIISGIGGASAEEALAALPKYFAGASGQAAYQDLGRWLGGDVQAAQSLKAVGIPGIKYLDQGSRGKTRWAVQHPQGGINEFADEASAKAFAKRNGGTLLPPDQTHNYVLFDDSLAKILSRD